MGELLQTYFDIPTMVRVSPLLGQGLAMTLGLAALCVPLAIALGLALAVVQDRKSRLVNFFVIGYIDTLRAIPPLALLAFIFYALPFVGITLGEYWAAVAALVMNGGAYFAEIFRAGLESVPRGQREAGRSTGLSATQTMAYIVVPQGAKNVMPDLASNTLELVKQTAIASTVGITELLRAAQQAQSLVYNPTPIIAAALIYLALLWPLVRWISRLQNQMAVAR